MNIKKIKYIINKILNVIYTIQYSKITPYNSISDRVIKVIGSDYRRSSIPKTIWIYWNDDYPPKLINTCINRILELHCNYDVRHLNSHTVKKYLSNSEFLDNKDISVQIKADLIRLNLIYEYGGIWLDASIILNENLDWVFELSEEHIYDFIGFYRDRLSNNMTKPIIENWMICAPPENEFIKEWLDIFSPIKDLGSLSYLIKLKQHPNYDKLKQDINMPEYLSAYIAAQIALNALPNTNLYLKCAETTAYFYQESYPQNNYFLGKIWCKLPAPKALPPIIKLTGQNRKIIESYPKVNKESIIGRLLSEYK